MANMMLDCLQNHEQGETIRLKMLSQYEELMAEGVDYQLKGVTYERERHFNLQPLITALSTKVANYDEKTRREKELHWCTAVGLAQTLLPAHIRHHYCDPDESFWEKPSFMKLKLERSLKIYNWILGKSQLWSESVGRLGLDFGVSSAGLQPGDPHGAECSFAAGPCGVTFVDLAALKALDEVRTNIDMPLLRTRLYTPIQKPEESNCSGHESLAL